MMMERRRTTGSGTLAALRGESTGFAALAVLVLLFQMLLPVAGAAAGPHSPLASLCRGLGDGDIQGEPVGPHGIACLCGPVCGNGACGAAMTPQAAFTGIDRRDMRLAPARFAATVALRPVRLLPGSRAPPRFS